MDVGELKARIIISDIIRPYISKGLRKSGSELVGLCPFHQENTPSFYVNDQKGLYYCHGCSASGDVVKFLQDKNNMTFVQSLEMVKNMAGYTTIPREDSKPVVPIIPVPTNNDTYQFQHGYSMVHEYRNEDGDLLYKVARYEKTDLRPKKIFLPATHTESGWVDNAPTEGRVLYNLASLKNSGMGFIVEGERCVDVGENYLPDRALVTWMGGSGAIKKTDFDLLKDGRKWCYWPDNDQGGIKTAAYLASIIPDLYVIPIPEGKPHGWDIAEAITVDGWGVEDVVGLINKKVLYRDLNHIQSDAGIPVSKVEIPTGAHKITINPYQLPKKLHGLCGEIEDWVNSTAYKKQPLLAINSSLVFIGAVKGQRVCTERNLLTNMYALSLGESGCGKDHPRQCLEILANAVGLQDKMMAGVPASGTALVKSVKRNGRCLIQIDELGRVIGNINGKNAGGFQREIVDNMMMLYSSASTLFREKEYAAGRENQEKNAIVKPCLCIHAMTVPERFYNNLTTDDVIDGFLSRWMIVASDNPDPDESEVDVDIEDIPQSIIDKITAIQEMDTNVKIAAERPITEAQIERIQNAINPKVIFLTPEAKSILTKYKDMARKLKNDLRTSGSPLNALWVRMGENAHKIALIIQEGDYITAEDMQWACDWVMYWTQYSIDQVKEKLSENDYDKRMKHLLGVIRKHTDGITKSELINHTKYGKRVREELLDELEESGSIRSELDESTTKKTKIYFAC